MTWGSENDQAECASGCSVARSRRMQSCPGLLLCPKSKPAWVTPPSVTSTRADARSVTPAPSSVHASTAQGASRSRVYGRNTSGRGCSPAQPGRRRLRWYASGVAGADLPESTSRCERRSWAPAAPATVCCGGDSGGLAVGGGEDGDGGAVGGGGGGGMLASPPGSCKGRQRTSGGVSHHASEARRPESDVDGDGVSLPGGGEHQVSPAPPSVSGSWAGCAPSWRASMLARATTARGGRSSTRFGGGSSGAGVRLRGSGATACAATTGRVCGGRCCCGATAVSNHVGAPTPSSGCSHTAARAARALACIIQASGPRSDAGHTCRAGLHGW